MLSSENEWLDEHKQEITEKIERVFEQFERGEFLSAEESKAEMQKRKAAWLAGGFFIVIGGSIQDNPSAHHDGHKP
jgi:hypothetical protein